MEIHVNQVGYRQDAKKIAIVTGTDSVTLYHDDTPVCSDFPKTSFKQDPASGDDVTQIDFSEITAPGTYHFASDKGERSVSFVIGAQPYRAAYTDMLRMFYFQRCGCGLSEECAGVFHHGTCHTTAATIYGTTKTKDVFGGWHDAGDYGRYVSPAAVTLGHLLYAFDLFHGAVDRPLHLPESGNGIPDLLNECRYELDFLLRMQAEDGGAYHKVTTPKHVAFIMPEADLDPLLIYPVSSMATADLAACTALASRIFRKYDAAYADVLLKAASRAYKWLQNNPNLVPFKNPADCHTGDYTDSCDLDERLWAACEYYRAAGDEACLADIERLLLVSIDTTRFTWSDVAGFAGLCVSFAPEDIFSPELQQRFRNAFLDKADTLLKVASQSGYLLSMYEYNFVWGSNMSVMNNAVVLVTAGLLSGNPAYTDAAEEHIHYLFGRNPLDISYVTGYGEHAFRNPHNRPTFADGIDDPIPGYVSGGPNGHPCDPDACALIPEGTPAMRCYADVYGSYSTNEIAIYWNSIAVLAFSYFQ